MQLKEAPVPLQDLLFVGFAICEVRVGMHRKKSVTQVVMEEQTSKVAGNEDVAQEKKHVAFR